MLGEDEWSVESGALIRFAVPGTLVGLLQSRLDALSSEERLALDGYVEKVLPKHALTEEALLTEIQDLIAACVHAKQPPPNKRGI